MTDYVVTVKSGTKNSAAVKAKDDITDILLSKGFDEVVYDPSVPKVVRALTSKLIWSVQLRNLNSGNVVFQYPLYSRIAAKTFLSVVNAKKNVKSIAVVHDVEGMRFEKENEKSKQDEISILNGFDFLIVHNSKMMKWLRENGVTTNMIDLGIFDYLNVDDMITNPDSFLTYAGNLTKGAYLQNLEMQTKVKLFGPNPLTNYPDNIEYMGSFAPEDLPSKLTGKFGLIWDGDSIDSGTGIYGEYLKYNNPHKTSLYLSMGIPVITWSGAAISEFIQKNGSGIALDTLKNLDEVLESISDVQYAKMKQNAEKIGSLLREGHFTTEALKTAGVEF